MKKKVVIDVCVADLRFNGIMDRWEQLAEEFNRAHPGHQVNIQGLDFFTFPQQLAQRVAEGRPPALAEYYFYTGQVARDALAADGGPLFTSVEKAVGGRTEILGEPVVLGDLIPPYREYYSLGGDLTSMPSVGTTSLLYANTDLLEAAGVTRLPQTWREVEAACEAVAALSNGPAHPITWSNHGTFFQQALASQGGLLVDNDNGRSGRARTADLSSPEMMNWVRWWQGLHRDGHFFHTGKIPDWAGSLKPFTEQQVAMRISSSNDVNFMVEAATNGGFGLEAGIFPFNDAVPYAGNAVAGTSIWLARGLDEPVEDGALAFLQFLHSPRNVAERHKAHSFVPITYAAHELLEGEGWLDLHPYHRAAYDHINEYPARAVPPSDGVPPSRGALFGDFAGNQDVMTRAMRDVLNGADPDERFTLATAEAQKLLDDYNAYAAAGYRDPAAAPNSSLMVEFWTDAEVYTVADLEEAVRAD